MTESSWHRPPPVCRRCWVTSDEDTEEGRFENATPTGWRKVVKEYRDRERDVIVQRVTYFCPNCPPEPDEAP